MFGQPTSFVSAVRVLAGKEVSLAYLNKPLSILPVVSATNRYYRSSILPITTHLLLCCYAMLSHNLCMHTYILVHTDRSTDRQIDRQTDRHAYIHAYMLLYIYIYIHTRVDIRKYYALTKLCIPVSKSNI